MRRSSIAPPQTKIVQNCKESTDYCVIDCPGLTSGEFLTCRGSPTSYYYITRESLLTVYKHGESLSSSREIYKHDFGIGTLVTSVAYFRVDENSDAILVLIRQARKSTTSDLSFLNCISLKTKRLLKSCVFHGKFNHLEVCIDGRQLSELSTLKETIQTYSNIVVLGGEECTAYMINMGAISESEEHSSTQPVPPVRKVSILRPDDNNRMEYRSGNAQPGFFAPETARVESLCYMSQRGVVAIGLSNGVIYFVSLKSGRTDSVCLGASVERMIVQHALNDSDCAIFLWAQIQQRDVTQLVLMSTLPNSSTSAANEMLFVPRFAYVPPGCVEFLQLRSVVLDRQQAIILGSSDESNDGDSSRDSNSSFAIRESARYNQLMMFLYIERFGSGFTLRGCVFDLDAYYSRRMPREATKDRTIAQQCGFMSHFRAKDLSFGAADTLDFLVTDIARFVPAGSLGTIDQHFYPSSLYFAFNLLSDSKAIELRVSCLQDQVVSDVAKNFIQYYQSPTEITGFLHAVGLCNSLANENESVMRTCLFRVLLHNYLPGCMSFLRKDDTNEEILQFAQKWLGKEVESTKSRFDEESKALFTTKPSDLPRPAFLFAQHSQLVFRRALQLYDVLIDRFVKMNVDQDTITRLRINKKICADLLLQISAILFGLHVDLLRDSPENVERMNKIRLGFGERRTIAARLGIRLEIYRIFDDVIEVSRDLEHYDELFGKRLAHELYPPESFVDLLDVLPNPSVSNTAKLQIFGYFTKDLDHFAPLPDQQHSSFNIMSGFLLNDQLTVEAMSEMLPAWDSDMRLLRINKMRELPGMEALKKLSDTPEKPYAENELRFIPCTNAQEREKLLKLYQQFPHGVHKFNMDMINRRRYEMIADPPAQTLSKEPEFVQHARHEVARVKRDYAYLFVRNSFDQSILDKCREQQGRAPHMSIQAADTLPLQLQTDTPRSAHLPVKFSHVTLRNSAKSTSGDQKRNNDVRHEAFPPRTPRSTVAQIRTPPNYDRFSALLPTLTPPSTKHLSATTPVQNALATPKTSREVNITNMPPPSPYIDHEASKLLNSAVKRKELDRLNRLTTPQSVRIRRERQVASSVLSVNERKRRLLDMDGAATSTPPAKLLPPKQPTSILRDNSNKRPRLANEPPRNIKFTEQQRVVLIPSNHENRELAQAETSFTEFAALHESSTDEVNLSNGGDMNASRSSPNELIRESDSSVGDASFMEDVSPNIQEEAVPATKPISGELAQPETSLTEFATLHESNTDEVNLSNADETNAPPGSPNELIREVDTLVGDTSLIEEAVSPNIQEEAVPATKPISGELAQPETSLTEFAAPRDSNTDEVNLPNAGETNAPPGSPNELIREVDTLVGDTSLIEEAVSPNIQEEAVPAAKQIIRELAQPETSLTEFAALHESKTDEVNLPNGGDTNAPRGSPNELIRDVDTLVGDTSLIEEAVSPNIQEEAVPATKQITPVKRSRKRNASTSPISTEAPTTKKSPAKSVTPRKKKSTSPMAAETPTTKKSPAKSVTPRKKKPFSPVAAEAPTNKKSSTPTSRKKKSSSRVAAEATTSSKKSPAKSVTPRKKKPSSRVAAEATTSKKSSTPTPRKKKPTSPVAAEATTSSKKSPAKPVTPRRSARLSKSTANESVLPATEKLHADTKRQVTPEAEPALQEQWVRRNLRDTPERRRRRERSESH